MQPTKILLIALCSLAGCTSAPPAVVLRHDGVRTVATVYAPPLEKYPFEQWNQNHEDALKSAGSKVWASHVAFEARKQKEWQGFISLWRPTDTVFRISGSRVPELFDYFVIVRADAELKRYYVMGGDGIPALE